MDTTCGRRVEVEHFNSETMSWWSNRGTATPFRIAFYDHGQLEPQLCALRPLPGGR